MNYIAQPSLLVDDSDTYYYPPLLTQELGIRKGRQVVGNKKV
jgi:hypothetical protein